MSTLEKFKEEIASAYKESDNTITLGAAIYEGAPLQNQLINIPIKTLNRHGLIAGATGTGKTKTIQGIAGSLAKKGVNILLMDIKGDLSGIAKAGEENPKILERCEAIGIPFQPSGHSVEFLSLSDEPGARLRATVSEFGPILFSKMIGLNETQGGAMALLFKYCSDHDLPLLNLDDVKKALHYLTNVGKKEIEEEYGAISKSSVSAILRKIVELEQQGAEKFFGEMSFDVSDLLRTDENGEGQISILRLTDIQNKPKLFSSFMLSLLTEIYSTFPEEGDLEIPKLVLFIDEAHLIFEEATSELLAQLEAIVKLIRSKGVGIIFCTQNPSDIPDDILGQLGLKVQHALRAFTAADRKKIKLTAENYPITEYYKTDQLLTSMGIGEALVTAINKRGIPTPLAATLLSPPDSFMGPLTDEEIKKVLRRSSLVEKYSKNIDSKSAYEILSKKINDAKREEKLEKLNSEREKIKRSGGGRGNKSLFEKLSGNTMVRQMGRTFARELSRSLMILLGLRRR